MKISKFIGYFVLYIVFTGIISCRKDDSESNVIKSPFTVRYELTANKRLDPIPFGSGVMWSNTTGSYSVAFLNSLPWIKEETITKTERPLMLILSLPEGIILESAGQVVGNIYINGVKKQTVTVNTSNLYGFDIAVLNMQYQVN